MVCCRFSLTPIHWVILSAGQRAAVGGLSHRLTNWSNHSTWDGADKWHYQPRPSSFSCAQLNHPKSSAKSFLWKLPFWLRKNPSNDVENLPNPLAAGGARQRRNYQQQGQQGARRDYRQQGPRSKKQGEGAVFEFWQPCVSRRRAKEKDS